MKQQRNKCGYAVALLVLIASTGTGCGNEKSTPTAPSAAPSPLSTPALMRVTIGGNLTLTSIGETAQLAATATLSDNSTTDVTTTGTWSVRDPRVATINSAGLVTVVGFGATTVSFSYQPGGSRTLYASSPVTASPPGTFAIAGAVKEPGAGDLQGASVIDRLSGRAVTSNVRGQFSMFGLLRSPVPLKVEKDGYETVEVDAVTPYVELRLQRVVRVVAGETISPGGLAPHDLTYTVGNQRCSPCRLIRVVVGQAGTVHVRVRWSPTTSPLSLLVEGQQVTGKAGELTADLPVSTARELLMYLGVQPGSSLQRKIEFAVETSVR